MCSALCAATPLAQDYTVVFHNPNPEYYVEGPGLAKLDNGSLLAVVPVVPREPWSAKRRVEHSVIHILRSHDGGETWQKLSTLPYYSAAPFLHQGKLYLFANKPGDKLRNDDLLLLRSDNNGETWSAPVTLFQGHYWNCDTSMVRHEDKIYWAVDDLSFGMNRGPRLVAGDLSRDPMDPAAWRISEVVKFPGEPTLMALPKHESLPSQYLEPNVIEVAGQLHVLCATKIHRPSMPGLVSLLDATDDGKKLDLKFAQYRAMPGGHLKFCILRDEASKLFWATCNLAVDSEDLFGWWDGPLKKSHAQLKTTAAGGNDRRFLMLQYSMDGMNWFPAGCVAQAKKLSQSFMYARPVVDGDDLAIVARSSINGPNLHDADYATFHRVKHFRGLALNLVPEPEKE